MLGYSYHTTLLTVGCAAFQKTRTACAIHTGRSRWRIESDVPDVKSSITAALAMCQFGINVAELAIERKQAWIWESSVGHGKDSIWPMAGKDLNSSMWHTTLLATFMDKHGLSLIYADRCMTGCQQRKTAGFLASNVVAPMARLTIGMLKCTHKAQCAA